MSALDAANHEVDKAAGLKSTNAKGFEQASSVHGCRAAPCGYDIELPKVRGGRWRRVRPPTGDAPDAPDSSKPLPRPTKPLRPRP